MGIWQEIFRDSADNTAIAASASETIKSTDSDISRYQYFNFLEVFNRSSQDIEVRLDGQDTAGKVHLVPANSKGEIKPEDGIFFMWFSQTNLSADTAQTADKIKFRWGKKIYRQYVE